MKKYKLIPCYLLFFFISFFQFGYLYTKPPRLTIVFIIDQLPHQTLTKLYPHLHGGIKFFMDKGITYTNAYVPHGRPATSTAHTGLNTGTYAKDHGIIDNKWFDHKTGNFINADDDRADKAAVFSPQGTYDYGKSAQYIMVDGISDQFVLQSEPNTPHHAISIALKSRSAIGTANKLGKGIWLDNKTGFFTSSKAYFDKLPDWLQTFNREKKASQLVLDLAQECIKVYMQQKPNNHLLLWVCLGSLDIVGHKYGPESLEVIDMLYHLDQQIKHFIEHIQKIVDKNEILFALTSDHGTSPIIELLQQEGITFARRINQQQFIAMLNNYIKNRYNVTGLVKALLLPNLYLDQPTLHSFPAETQKLIIADLKKFLQQQPEIKKVWTYDELENASFSAQAIENYFKKQLFFGRSGSLIIQVYPYVYLAPFEKGTGHISPYGYDTHVPLIIYQQGKFEHKKIVERVWILQLANTLAEILAIPKPSASSFEVLPKLFE